MHVVRAMYSLSRTNSRIVEHGKRSHIIDPLDLVSTFVFCPWLERLMQILGLDGGGKVGKGKDPGSGCGDGLTRERDVGSSDVGKA